MRKYSSSNQKRNYSPSSARISRKEKNRRVGRKITTKTKTIVRRMSHSKLEFSSTGSEHRASESYRNPRSSMFQFEEVTEEEFTDSILDELDGMESEYFENQVKKEKTVKRQVRKEKTVKRVRKKTVKSVRRVGTNSHHLVPVPIRTSIDAIMSFFGTTVFELALSEYRTKIFNSEISKNNTCKPVGYCFQSRSLCWGENEVYSQFLVFTKHRILKSKCTCVQTKGRYNERKSVYMPSRCVHCCSQMLNLWIGNDTQTPRKLYELTIQLKELRAKYSNLLSKYEEISKIQLVPPPPPLATPTTPKVNVTIPKRKVNLNAHMNVTIPKRKVNLTAYMKRTTSKIGDSTTLHKKSVSWKTPLTETISSQKNVEDVEEVKYVNGTQNSSVRKSFAILMNFNMGKPLVPTDITQKKRKRHSEFYDGGIPEKTDNIKKRKID